MSLISTWSTVANDNGTLGSTPYYWPEGQAPSTVNDCARLLMSTIRLQWNDAQWFNWGYTVTRLAGNKFQVVTASWNTVTIANVFQVNGRIKLFDTSTMYGTITEVSASSTVTNVTFTPDSGSLTSSFSSVYNSIITPDLNALPGGNVPADVVRQNGAQIWGVDGGSTDAYAISLNPTLLSYVAGESFNFKANTVNTGAATLNIDGLGAKSIVNPDGSALSSNAIPAGSVNHVVFDGTNFQLIGNGSASSSGGFNSVKIQVFTSTSTYTPTSGMKYCIIEALGGGAGGGGCVASNATDAAGAGGGGAGSYSRTVASSAMIGSSQTVTIGAGGTGGSAGANNGTNGGDTSVGVLCVGKGGTGGIGAPANTCSAGGGGGVAGTGDVTSVGQVGDYGIGYAGLAANLQSFGGRGGGSVFGNGAPAKVGPGAGNSATGYGAGGSGATSTGTTGAEAGGNGTAGLVIITEYIG